MIINGEDTPIAMLIIMKCTKFIQGYIALHILLIRQQQG